MNDPRFNSIHLDAQPRREDYRRARERLFGACGSHTIAIDLERLAEDPHPHPHTIIESPDNIPTTVKFWLIDKDTVLPLRPGVNSIGRMPDNDVVIADGSVSRRHCAIVVHQSRGCEIHDTASKNGTFLNGKKIVGPTRLVPGDEIRLCDHTIVFQGGDVIPSPLAASAVDSGFAQTIG
jgi:hypothetical protein